MGACAWAKVSPEEKKAFTAAYHGDIGSGMAKLGEHTAAYRALITTCLGREGAPGLWEDSALGAQAIQEGAVVELKTLKGLDRAALEQGWLAAPETARSCARANAAKLFGIERGPCPDGRAPLAFLPPLKIAVTPEDQESVRHALYYFTAKAQAEWAELLLAKFKTDGPPKPPAGGPAPAPAPAKAQ